MELLIVGLDGLSDNMLREFNVNTPTLDSVRSEGVYGELESVDTPTTLPAWTSFATGTDPGTHGVPTMLQQSADYSIDPAACNRTLPAIYDFLDDSVLVNLPASIERVPVAENVHLVSSILAKDRKDAVPRSLQSLDSFENYIVHDDGNLKSDPEDYVEHLCEVVRSRHSFASEAFDRYDPRIGFVLFSAPDWIGHFLKFAPDDEIREHWYRQVVELVDRSVADIMKEADNVVLMSDHGFEYKPRALHIQEWLLQEEYMKKAHNASVIQRFATGTAKQIAKRFDNLFDILQTVYRRAGDAESGARFQNWVDFNPEISFAESRAWHLRYGCLHINDDRFERPMVEDTQALREELRDRLSSLTDDDGNSVFSSIEFPETAYSNPDFEHRLPDIIARPASGVIPLRAFSPTGSPVHPTPGYKHYDHRYKGIFAATGPLFKSDQVEDMSIVDVLPTIIHALDEPLSPGFDGHIRSDILDSNAEPTWLDAAEIPSPRTREKSDTEARERVARDQLRELGYLE